MKRLVSLVGLLLIIAACSPSRQLRPALSPLAEAHRLMHTTTAMVDDCLGAYPHGRVQFWHAITATLPGGLQRHMMGAVVVDSKKRSLDWALMTVEGLVLFQGHHDPSAMRVDRAVTPFDKAGFARGMVADLQFIWLPPAGRDNAIVGRTASGLPRCRFAGPGAGTLDIERPSLDGWRVWQYDAARKLKRTLEARQLVPLSGAAATGATVPLHLTLTRPGPGGYTLEMELMEALALEEKP